MSKTQIQLWRQAEQKAADANHTFLFLVDNGLTREDLQKLIARRPSLYSRFSNWLDVLPSGLEVAP